MNGINLEITFKKKISRAGEEFFQGIEDHKDWFLFKLKTQKGQTENLWKLHIKTYSRRI